jgi:hypothetical protein
VAAALVARLEEAGLVVRADGEIRPADDGAGIEERARQLAGQFETLRTQDARRLDSIAEYAAAPGCRAAFLRGYFGEDEGGPCGLCDICQRRPARSDRFFAPLALPARAEGRKRGRRKKRPRAAATRPAAEPRPAAGPRPAAETEGSRRRRRRGRGRRGGRSARARRGRAGQPSSTNPRGPDPAPPASVD